MNFLKKLFGKKSHDQELEKSPPAPPSVTFIYTYYNQVEMLKLQLENWESWPEDLKSRVHFMLVDDGSKIPAVDHLSADLTIDLSVYRVMEDLYCNIGGARNLGTRVCPTEWMLHSDMDHIIPASEAEKILALADRNERKVYKFQRIEPDTGKTKIHPGTMLLTRALYWEIGGCDEDFVGNYGQTDIHFFYRADRIVETEKREDIQLVIHRIGESDIDRSVEKREPNRLLYEEKKQNDSWSTDFIRFAWERQR